MKSISKTSDKCQKCSNHDTCDNKRMEACGMLQMPLNITINISPQTNNQTDVEDVINKLQKELECAMNRFLE